MDLRSLMNKLDAIAEDMPPMPRDGGRAQYDKFKADDARAAAVAQVKQWMSTPLSAIARLGVAIDPKTGIIYYGDAGGANRGGNDDYYEAKAYPYKWLADPSSTSSQSREIYQVLSPAGLKVIPVEKKHLFGTHLVAGISPQQLADLDKPVAPVPTPDKPEQNTKPPRQMADCDKSVAQLNALSAKLQARMDALASVKKESRQSIADALVESFGYQTENDLAKTAAVGAGTYGATKAAGRMLGKAIPGVGLAFGAADAYNRAKKGDYVGAGIAGLSGVTSLLPGLGTAATVGLDAANIARDYKRGDFNDVLPANMAATTNKTQNTKPAGVLPPGADPKVFALQGKLITAGAKINQDGKMGPATQAAMKQFPMVRESLAESMGSLRDRLALIEREQRDYSPTQEVQADEGIYGDALKQGAKGFDDLVNFGKNVFKGKDAKVVKPPTPPVVKPTTTPTGTVYKKKAGNPNIAAEVPYVQGRAGTGPNPTQFAKFDPATSAVARATTGVDDMVRGGVKAAGDDVAKVGGKVVGNADDVAKVGGKVVGNADDVAKVGGKVIGSADDVAKVGGKVIGSADDVAKAGSKVPGWAKKIGTAAAVGAGAYGLSTLLDKDKPPVDGPVKPPVDGPVVPPEQNTKPDAEAQAIIDQMKKLMMDCGEYDAPAWAQATSNAMALIGKVEAKKGGEAQVAADREAAMRVPASANASSSYTGVPAGTTISR